MSRNVNILLLFKFFSLSHSVASLWSYFIDETRVLLMLPMGLRGTRRRHFVFFGKCTLKAQKKASDLQCLFRLAPSLLPCVTHSSPSGKKQSSLEAVKFNKVACFLNSATSHSYSALLRRALKNKKINKKGKKGHYRWQPAFVVAIESMTF